MTYVRYHSSRTRERDPYDSDDFYSRPLVRLNSKRQHTEIFKDDDDDDCDDYPYSPSHKTNKLSRALIVRQPSQLEKYNIWSNPRQTDTSGRHRSPDSDCDEDRTIRYRYTTTRHAQPSYRCDDDESDHEREFRLKVKASFGRPRSSHSSHKVMAWPAELFKRREKLEHEDWETRERERQGDWWDEEEPRLKERTVRYHRLKRTRTDEWKPLSGWKRS